MRELSERANKLSEVQAMPKVTKESRQIMAKSSFAVRNAMKGSMVYFFILFLFFTTTNGGQTHT